MIGQNRTWSTLKRREGKGTILKSTEGIKKPREKKAVPLEEFNRNILK